MNTNMVIESGNITMDPDYRVSPNGIKTLFFSIAVNESYYDKKTEKYKNIANFFDCIFYGNQCDYYIKRLKKGDHVLVRGKLRQSRWTGADGQAHSKVQIVVDNIEEFNYLNKINKSSSSPESSEEDYEYNTNDYYGENGGFME